MIHIHCTRPLVPIGENREVFQKRCPDCGEVFTQRKRRPKTTNQDETESR